MSKDEKIPFEWGKDKCILKKICKHSLKGNYFSLLDDKYNPEKWNCKCWERCKCCRYFYPKGGNYLKDNGAWIIALIALIIALIRYFK